jgi:hypothetical protein
MLILMSICMLANPSQCREERLSFSLEQASAFACMVHSQEVIAEWQQSHPAWRVNNWRCVERSKAETPI